MNHYIYQTTNLVNGKKYIGKRSCKCAIEKDKYLGSGKYLKKALKKYGTENFKKEILEICESEEVAFEREKLYIERVKAYSNDEYYNIASGGEGGYAVFAGKSQEELDLWKTRMSNSRKGRIITEEWKRKILETRKLNGTGKGESNPMFGVKGSKHPISKAVMMISLDGKVLKEFECLRETNDYFNKPKCFNLVSRVCIYGGTAYGYLWLFKEDYLKLIENNEFDNWYLNTKNRYIDKNIKAKRSKINKNSKKVYQLNKITLEVMCEFDSIKLASECTGIRDSSISRVCHHGCNTAGGYSWAFKEEYKSLTKDELKILYSYKPARGYSKPNAKRKVICLNTNQVFDGICDAIEYFNLCRGAKIGDACTGKRKSVGKHPETNEPLRWAYSE